MRELRLAAAVALPLLILAASGVWFALSGPGSAPGDRAKAQSIAGPGEPEAPPTAESTDAKTAEVVAAPLPDEVSRRLARVLGVPGFDTNEVESAESFQPAEPRIFTTAHRLRRGENLVRVLERAGAGRREAHLAANAFDQVYRATRLRAGLEITVLAQEDASGVEASFHGFEISPEPARTIRVTRVKTEADSFTAESFEEELDTVLSHARGEVTWSLYQDGRDAGIPPEILVDFIQLFSFDVDFQRDVRKGDGFELVYEQDVMKSGEIARNGRILFAAFDTRFGPKAYYHFTPEDGRADHFDAKGHSARRLLMRTPINGARLSSGFGKRRHPILGYTRMHNGVDFAAPTGTPILAAGDGRIDRASWYGGYGRFVRIEHANGYKTAYAHLSRYGPGIKKGVRVKQGQVIGYLGSSGLATGPHLHYEVLKDGRRINPRSLRAPTGKILEGAELEAFQTARLGFQTRLARLRKDPVDTPTTLASEATASQPATPPSQ